MSSRRKNSNPCMVQSPEHHDRKEAADKDISAMEQPDASEKENQCPGEPQKPPKVFECKYCPFASPSMGDFKDHVDSSHPDVILNPVYLCVQCGFRTKKFDALTEHNDEAHPGEAAFQYRKKSVDGYTLLEQTVEGEDSRAQDDAASGPSGKHTAEGKESTGDMCEQTERDGEKVDAALFSETIIEEEQSHRAQREEQSVRQSQSAYGTVPSEQTAEEKESATDVLVETEDKGKSTERSHSEEGEEREAPEHTVEEQEIMNNLLEQSESESTEHTVAQLQSENGHKESANGNDGFETENTETFAGQTVDRSLSAAATSEQMMEAEERPSAHGQMCSEPVTREKQRINAHTVSDQVEAESAPSPNSTSQLIRRLEQIRALRINGTVIIPEASILKDTLHVSPKLQRPPDFSRVAQIAVPLNTFKYNPSLDDNATLMASFHRFPYPTHAELSWLTAASKHPEEQIRVWFTTQRLKQGISWSPEEVEEARKKMFNGTIPQMHSTFTVLPTSPLCTPARSCLRNYGTPTRTCANPAANGLKRILNAPALGPESKRPVMAVAPNPGDKGLMAPPPVPPLQHKPTDAKRANETKRSLPLLQTPLRNKVNVVNGSKTKVSLPSIVFPESLTRPLIVPPPIFAPQFKMSASKAHISLPNGALQNSTPLIAPQLRRPAVIQALRGNAPNGDSFSGTWNEASVATGPHAEDPQSELQQKAHVLTQFPLLERMKGKSSEQLKVLEESFLRNSFPSQGEAEALAVTARLSRNEVESWFGERRALRDNLEQALLNSMGTKRNGHHGNGHHGNGHNGHGHHSNGHHSNGLHSNGLHSNGLHSNGLHSNGHYANGHYSNGLQTNGNHVNMLQTNAHHGNGSLHNGLKPGGTVDFGLSRAPDEAVSRWSFDDLSQRWYNGKTGSVLPSYEVIGPRCQGLTNESNGRAQEAELSWFNKNISTAHEHFRFPAPTDLQGGGVFGRWADRRLDLRPDLSEESSG
ncbi:unnamed protein product [Knipowitschia caucasica]